MQRITLHLREFKQDILAVSIMMAVDASAARAPPWMTVAVDVATLDGVGLDGGGRHRLAGCHRPGATLDTTSYVSGQVVP